MTELRGEDPARWGHSLANLGEILVALFDAVGAKTVAEVGAYAGDLTRDLMTWAESAGAQVIAVDPAPQPELIQLSESRDDLQLIREPSLDALPDLPAVDVVLVDGDHNYYTVSEELRLVAERFPGSDAPLVIMHDVSWPHARRDAYYVPERIPVADRQPMVEGGCLFPGEPGVVDGGLPYKWVAEREGGAHNGVLTALEDFVESRSTIRLATVQAFFGLGVLWRRDAPWADAVAEVMRPWDQNPVVARLEANRVYHLANEYSRRHDIHVLRAQNKQKVEFLQGLLDSRAFTFAERLYRLGKRGRGDSWREMAQRMVDES